ncbi:unnamed protein product [Prunus brigantina]
MGVETLFNSGFLQVFLWEHLKGLDVHSLPHSHAMKLADWGRGSYMPESLPLVCRWFKRMQRKGQDFLKLLDNVENFVFRPYCTSTETFTFVPFYVDVSDTVEVPAAMSQSGQFRKYAMLNVAPISLPTLVDSRSEISVPYSPHRVRRQFGLDQGVLSSPNHTDPFVLHRSPCGSGKNATPVSGKRKREEEQNVREKKTAGKPKRFKPKVASSGPPRTKEATPPERPQSSKPATSESRGRAGKVLETTLLRRKMGTTPKRRRSSITSVSAQATPKCRSMRVLQAKFTGARTSGSEASGTRTVVTIDDDNDDGDTTES